MQKTQGVYLIRLRVVRRGVIELHWVVASFDFRSPKYPTGVGVLLDNDKTIPVKIIEESDRPKDKARELFESLFPVKVTQYRVQLIMNSIHALTGLMCRQVCGEREMRPLKVVQVNKVV